MPYEVRRYERNKTTMLAPPELRHVHPLGKSPVIEDRDSDGEVRVIAETGAIIEYIVERSGGKLGAPRERADALRYRHFLHYAEGSVKPVLFVKLVLSRVPLLGRVALKRFHPLVDVQVNYGESELAGRPWFAGQSFTAIPGTCDLHQVLQDRQIDTLIVTGTLTNCCCESTARDAMQLNYKVVFVSDANAALSDAEHNATLNNMCALFADVMSTAELITALSASSATGRRLASVAPTAA